MSKTCSRAPAVLASVGALAAFALAPCAGAVGGGTVAAVSSVYRAGMLLGLEGGAGGVLFRLRPRPIWSRVPRGPGGTAGVLALTAASRVSVVYAATVDEGQGSGPALHRSDDGGRTWHRLGWPPRLPDVGRSAPVLAVDAVRPWVVLVALDGVVLRSGDAGRGWRRAMAGLPGPVARARQVLVADGRRAGTFYVSTPKRGVYRSDDAGRRWRRTARGLVGVGGRAPRAALASDPIRAGTVYAADARGLFRTRDGGAHWRLVRRIAGGARAPVAGGANVFAAAGRGLAVSDDGGTTWQEVLGPGALAPDRLALDAAGTLLAVTRFEDPEEGARCVRVFSSTNGGRSWIAADEGLPLPRRRCWLYASRVG